MHTVGETVKSIVWVYFEYIHHLSAFFIFLLKRWKIQRTVKKKFGWSLQDETVNAGEGTNPIIHLRE